MALPDLPTLAVVSRAIRQGVALKLKYHSATTGSRSQREIVPFALMDTDTRWRVRAYDRKSRQFRDFVLNRIHEATLLPDSMAAAHEHASQDLQWTRIVELELVPHPDQPHPQITELDYGMHDGSLTVRLRAAMAGYILRNWNVDCSPDHALRGPGYRLWLRDPLTLYGVLSAALAPGYVNRQTSRSK